VCPPFEERSLPAGGLPFPRHLANDNPDRVPDPHVRELAAFHHRVDGRGADAERRRHLLHPEQCRAIASREPLGGQKRVKQGCSKLSAFRCKSL
jgi:hypothetical protein